MDLKTGVQSYLLGISFAVDSFSKIVCCKELEENVEILHKIIVNTLEFERFSADFINEMELSSIRTIMTLTACGRKIIIPKSKTLPTSGMPPKPAILSLILRKLLMLRKLQAEIALKFF